MKKLLFICFLVLTSLQLCSQGWVPQRAKYSYLDSVSFTKDVNVLVPLRLQNSFTLGATTITSNGAELNILDGALVNYTELNYLVGVTSGIQAQINTKSPINSPTFTGTVILPSTTSIGLVSAAELGWLDDVTSSIQTQLNSKAASSHNHTGVYEPSLGNPGVDGYILSSSSGGLRSWIAPGGIGGSMTYPGVGIALSTGSAWATSITDNSSNWNTAYGWGNHASAGYLTSQTSHADVLVDGDFISQGIMLRGASSGVYSILDNNSANWNTAYSWGNHASAGYFVGTNSTIRALLSSSATGLTYTNSTGVFSLTSGYVIPSTTEQSNWNTAYGWGNHASAGYASLTNPSFVTGITTPAITIGATAMTSSATELNILDGATLSTTELNYVDGVTSNIQAQLNDTTDLETVFLPRHLTVNPQTASYVLVLTDDAKIVTVSVGSANTLTVPPNSSVAFPVGTQVTIVSIGTGQTTITPGSGVTINSAGGALKLRVQYSSCTLIKTATDTWLCIGDITT